MGLARRVDRTTWGRDFAAGSLRMQQNVFKRSRVIVVVAAAMRPVATGGREHKSFDRRGGRGSICCARRQ